MSEPQDTDETGSAVDVVIAEVKRLRETNAVILKALKRVQLYNYSIPAGVLAEVKSAIDKAEGRS